MIKTYEIRIYGRVFNVGFRRYVHRYAIENDITGFVENDRADESVHIIAQGEAEKLERFTILCGEGTPYSFVVDMKIQAIDSPHTYLDFKQVR